MHRSFLIRMLLTVMLMVMTSGVADAATTAAPPVLQYQAQIGSADGSTLSLLSRVDIVLYDSPTLGSASDLNGSHVLYAETHRNVAVDQGLLRLGIGTGEGLGRFAGAILPVEVLAQVSSLSLELTIEGERLDPRQRIAMSPNALRAAYAKKAQTLTGPLTLTAANIPQGFDASHVKGTLAAARLPQQFSATQIQGVLSPDRLDLLPLEKIVSGTLETAVIGAVSGQKIVGGPFPANVIPGNLLSQDNVAIVADDIANNAVLPIPAGFTQDQCYWIVGLKDLNGNGRITDQLMVHTGMFAAPMFDTGHWGRTVRCFSNGRPPVGDELAVPCTARYFMICKR